MSPAPESASGGGPAAHQAVIINADGGSRGNPGPAGYGAVVFATDGTVLAERAASLGVATNNVAEYSGLIAGLEAARDLGASRVTARMDSKLVVEQMSGRWKIKHPDMKPLANRASALVAVFDLVDFEWVPRAENSYADRLANEAMDAALDGRVWVRAAAPAAAADPDPQPETEQPETVQPETAQPETVQPETVQAETVQPETVQPETVQAVAESPDENGDLDTRPTEQDPAAALPPPRDGEPTRFLVVRHGETTWGAQAKFAGRSDVPLTGRGRRQATAVAGRIRRLAPVAVLTSPLQRCRNTAQAIAAEVGAPVLADDRLIDGLLGEWTGFRATEIEARWPQQFADWRSDPDASPPGGESFNEIRRRVRPVMTDTLSTYRGHTVVLVTHAAPGKMILATALNVDSAVAYRIRVDTASLSGFTVEADGTVMVWAVNETGHLGS